MIGQRLHLQPGEYDFLLRIAETPGAYGTIDGKTWYCCTPNGMLGNLGAHNITEHDDGTITVAPSILVSSGSDRRPPMWHGHLERGEWKEC